MENQTIICDKQTKKYIFQSAVDYPEYSQPIHYFFITENTEYANSIIENARLNLEIQTAQLIIEKIRLVQPVFELKGFTKDVPGLVAQFYNFIEMYNAELVKQQKFKFDNNL